MVHLFDELARTIADGTQIVSLTQNGSELNLAGRAQSNARVSTYMRNLSASGWMANPDLSVIELRGSNPGLPNEFQLKVQLKDPNAVSADAAAAAAAGGATPAVVDPATAGAAPPAISPPSATPGEVAPAAAPVATPAVPGASPATTPATNPVPASDPAVKPAAAAGGTP